VLELLPTDFMGMFGTAERPAARGVPRPFQTASGSQNVHDHGVSATVARNAAELLRRCAESEGRRAGVPPDAAACARANEGLLDAALGSDLPDRDKEAVLQVLDTLGAETHSRFGVSERQLLGLAWEFVGRLEEPRRADMKRNLCAQIATAVEGGKTVCSTGKMARVVAAFDGTGLLGATVVPMAAVSQELAAMAVRGRESGEAPRDAAARLRSEARKMYVDDLGLSASVVGPLIDSYADALEQD
jgi:hypothetical protein